MSTQMPPTLGLRLGPANLYKRPLFGSCARLVGFRALTTAAYCGDDIAICGATRERLVDIGRGRADRRRGCRGVHAIGGPTVNAVLRNTRSCGLSPSEVDSPRLGGV